MKQQEEQIERERIWDSIEISTDYGYFASNAAFSITCYSDGMLVFKTEDGSRPLFSEERIEDRNHEISKKSLAKLDTLVEDILGIKELKGWSIEDGPSFECYVQMENGTVRGFHYVSMILTDEHEQLENKLRKIMREEFFLRKHKNELRS